MTDGLISLELITCIDNSIDKLMKYDHTDRITVQVSVEFMDRKYNEVKFGQNLVKFEKDFKHLDQ